MDGPEDDFYCSGNANNSLGSSQALSAPARVLQSRIEIQEVQKRFKHKLSEIDEILSGKSHDIEQISTKLKLLEDKYICDHSHEEVHLTDVQIFFYKNYQHPLDTNNLFPSL